MTGKPIAALLAVLVAFGCSNPPTTSTVLSDDVMPPEFEVVRVTDIEEDFSLDGWTEFNDCLGEWLTWHGSWYFITRTTTTPSGNVVWHFSTGYNTPTPLRAEVLTGPLPGGVPTGEHWTQTNGESYGGSVSKSKGTAFTFHYQGNEFYSNQDGDKLKASWKGRVMVDADGNVTQNRDVFEYSCH